MEPICICTSILKFTGSLFASLTGLFVTDKNSSFGICIFESKDDKRCRFVKIINFDIYI